MKRSQVMFVGKFCPTGLTFGKDFFSISQYFWGHPVETMTDFIGVLMLADEVDIEESFDDSLTTSFSQFAVRLELLATLFSITTAIIL